ncbi:MAG: hypothetical protein AVDCRST_MAG85-3556, partial [uncultured Solirubrobacteraceae bacterium]
EHEPSPGSPVRRGRARMRGRCSLPRPRRLRSHRSLRVPASVPERLLHGRRGHADRQARRAVAQRHAEEPVRQADRPVRPQPRRRLQPRLDAHREGPRPRHARRLPRLQAPADRRPAPVAAQEVVGRRHQRADAQAPPRLGRDRLEPRGPRRPHPDRPPGQELRRGRALHRRAAQPARGRRRPDPRQRRLRLVPRRHGQGRPGRGHGPGPRPARQGGRPAQGPLPRLGLHDRQRRVDDRPHAVDPRPRVRRPRRHEPRRPQGRGPRPRRDDQPEPARRAPDQGQPGQARRHHRLRQRPDRAQGARAPRRAVLPQRARVPDGLPVPDRRRRQPGPDPRQHHDLRLQLQHPADRRQGAPDALRPRPARPAGRDRLGREPGLRRPVRLHVLRRRLERHGVQGHPERPDRPPGPLAVPDARRPHRAGLPRLPVPRARAHPPGRPGEGPGLPGQDRHERAVLRRQLAGRHLRRRAARHRARPRARRARRPRHELLDPPASQRRLRRLRGGRRRHRHRVRDVRPVPQRARAAVDLHAHPDAVGPRRPERLRRPHDERPAAEHADAQGAAAGRLRRPPGRRRHHRGRGADRRHARAPAAAGAGSRALPRPPVPRRADARDVPGRQVAGRARLRVRRLGRRVLRHRQHAGAMGREHPAARGRRPARERPPDARRQGPEVRVPEERRRDRRRLRRALQGRAV